MGGNRAGTRKGWAQPKSVLGAAFRECRRDERSSMATRPLACGIFAHASPTAQGVRRFETPVDTPHPATDRRRIAYQVTNLLHVGQTWSYALRAHGAQRASPLKCRCSPTFRSLTNHSHSPSVAYRTPGQLLLPYTVVPSQVQ